MRVLLVSTNRSRETMPPFPLGLAYVASNIDKRHHEVEVWDAMFQEDWEKSLRDQLRRFRPGVIGLSVRNVDDQNIRSPRFFLEETKRIVGICREETGASIVAGGSGLSIFPREAMSYLAVDFGVVGEGENAFNMVLNRLEANEVIDEIPGLARIKEGLTHSTLHQWIETLDDLKPPDRLQVDAKRYYESPGGPFIPNVATVQGKRGCPLSCIYCSTLAIEGVTIRTRSPKRIVDEIEILRGDLGFRRIHFVDSLFTNPPWHADAVCQEILRRRIDIQWNCTINPGFAQLELLNLMRSAGCELVMVGNESGCSRILRTLRKGFEKEEVEQSFSLCRKAGLRYHAFLLIGGPGEDRKSIEESVELLERYKPDQVTVTVGIRIYPGCELVRVAEGEGVIESGINLLVPRFYLSPSLGDWIWDYMDQVMARNHRWTF